MRTTKYIVNKKCYEWSKELAYFLGLFLADGYYNDTMGYLEVTLTESDQHILESIKSWLFDGSLIPNAQFISYDHKTIRFQDYETKRSNMYRLRILDKKFVSFFTSLGVTNRKSFTLEFPYVPHEFLSHFMRGMIDGDGWISYFNKADSLCVGFVSSVMFCEKAKDILLSLGFKFKTKIHKEYSHIMHSLWMHGNRQSAKFLEWLYKDSGDFYLKRKRETFEMVKAKNLHKDLGLDRKGYTWSKIHQRFIVRIKKNKITLVQKYFKEEKDAREFYLEFKRQMLESN